MQRMSGGPVLTGTLHDLSTHAAPDGPDYCEPCDSGSARELAVCALQREKGARSGRERSLRDNAQQVYGIVDGEAIWRRYVPGRINGEGPVVLLLWDAVAGTDPVPLQLANLGNFEGRANAFERPAQTRGLAGSSKPERDLWYGFNAAAMLTNLGYSESDARVVEPDTMRVVLATDMSRARTTQNPYAMLTGRDPLPPERHFGYALTWWGMAIGLIGVYIAFHRSQGRLKFGGKS